MLILLLSTVLPVAYLLTARKIYLAFRQSGQPRYYSSSSHWGDGNFVAWYPAWQAALSMLLAVIFPLVIAAGIIMYRPPRTDKELREAERAAQARLSERQKYIEDLEAENSRLDTMLSGEASPEYISYVKRSSKRQISNLEAIKDAYDL